MGSGRVKYMQIREELGKKGTLGVFQKSIQEGGKTSFSERWGDKYNFRPKI
jgi:hypothetical protein